MPPTQVRSSIQGTRPKFTLQQAQAIAVRGFGVHGTPSELPGECDQSFLLACTGGDRFVLKIARSDEDPAGLALQVDTLRHLVSKSLPCALPRVVDSLSGSPLFAIEGPRGEMHSVRLLTHVEGRSLVDVPRHARDLLRQIGGALGALDLALIDFAHPGARRSLKWDLLQCDQLRAEVGSIPDAARRASVERLYARAQTSLAATQNELPRSVIHNDANDYNVLVRGSALSGYELSGLIDFGDVVETITVAELAIAIAYAMLGKRDPLAVAAHVAAGYHVVRSLSEAELEVLYDLIGLRLAMSATNSARQRTVEADNAYLQISEAPVLALLDKLEVVHPRFARYHLRQACGFSACPASVGVVRALRQHAPEVGPLMDPDPRVQVRTVYDLSVGSLDLGGPTLWADLEACTHRLQEVTAQAGATIGIGSYAEARPLYLGPAFAVESEDGIERRTVHIGTDLFAPAGTTLLAPLDGVVHAVRDNANLLDYGPTLILEHTLSSVGAAPDARFYTLYGHLGRELLTRLSQGQRVRRGDVIASIGAEDVNGGWPPHVHFQIVCDLLDRDGEFPGVARPSEVPTWLSISPDPNLFLQLPELAQAPDADAVARALGTRRAKALGPSLSLSYSQPMHIVRGFMQHLYDSAGQPYLDAVNNVPVVGHSHPRVVQAASQQMAVLNTNTRFLHASLVRYAERLSAHLPPHLSVCYFVNSGSEANELALRMARAHTGRRGVVVLEGGYHGNTTTLVDVSPYKFLGKGGAGRPGWVEIAASPDPYRGRHRGAADAAARYALEVRAALQRARSEGGAAAVLLESVGSCAGQIVPPEGYLPRAFEYAREDGAVGIADEVQTGFARAGSHFFAFEALGARPDIVTLGKPIGNGHPLGAVVTTPEIAASFANGMEYFNTFGGNPVSCAVGLAVLDVIEVECLQGNAQRVGDHLLATLRALQERHALIGDVRGLGLFLGVELVRDRDSLVPAAAEASYVAERMRDFGVLVGTDGPLHNVLKLKPPLMFSRQDADTLVAALDRALGELQHPAIFMP